MPQPTPRRPADKTTLGSAFERLGATDYKDASSLIAAAVEKLREHDVRIVLFMEQAMQFGSFAGPEQSSVRDALAELAKALGLRLPEDYAKRYINYRLSEWAPHANALMARLLALAHGETPLPASAPLRIAV